MNIYLYFNLVALLSLIFNSIFPNIMFRLVVSFSLGIMIAGNLRRWDS